MKSVFICKCDGQAMISKAGMTPTIISNEMADCLIRQYRLTGWTEDKMSSDRLWHFYQIDN